MRFDTLFKSLLIPVVIALLIAAVAAAALTTKIVAGHIRTHQELSAKNTGGLLAGVAAPYVTNFVLTSLANLVKQLGKDDQLLFAEIVDPSGKSFTEDVMKRPDSLEGALLVESQISDASGGILGKVKLAYRTDGVKMLLDAVTMAISIAMALVTVAVGFVLSVSARGVVRQIGGEPREVAAIAAGVARGDLSATIKLQPGDKDSVLAAMHAMQQTLQSMIGEIRRSAEALSTASEGMLHSSEEISSRSQQQSEAAGAMAAAVQEMTVSIDQVANNAREAHDISVQAGGLAIEGTQVIQTAATEMRGISDAVHASSAVIADLGNQSDQITSIVNTIREIADQTNLLALNAAIEAARAGEQGRGFAVVADEVRKLAERTSLSTAEIAGMVSKIQSGTRKAVESMDAGVAQAGAGVALAEKAATSITEIRDGAERVMSVVNSISQSINEQGTASNEFARNIERVARMSEEGVAAMQHTADAARNLQQLSASLNSAIGRFKLS